jgi:hypothetical protein
MIDLREDGLAQLQFANQLGSQIGGTIAGIYNIKQKKLQQFRDEETQKAVVNIASDPNITSAQALQKLKGIKDAVNVKLTEYDKMLIQQAENIRQQNAAIAPQVKSQMFDAARGMDFNGLTPDMMAQERQAGNAANAYGQLDRATGFSVPELGQMAQPTNQPLDGRINDVFGRPLQGTTQDTFGGLTNTFNAGVASGKEQLSKPQGKYGTMPWWMHPDYKDTPEGIAAMQAATRIPGTSTGTRGGEGALNKQAVELQELMKRAKTPAQVSMLKKQLKTVYSKLGIVYEELPLTDAVATDIFKKIFFGDGDKNKGIGKGKGRATEGETQIAFDNLIARFIENGDTWQQAADRAVRLYDAAIAEDNRLIGDSRLTKGKTGKDFVSEIPEQFRDMQDAQQGQGYGNRVDGTPKGSGWLGEIPMTDGSNRVMTEMSIGVNIDGKEMLIPSIVPTLTKEEVNWLAQGGDVTSKDPIAVGIINKAVQHAIKQLKSGKSVWAEYTTGSGNNQSGTQDVVGNKLTMPGAKSKVDNPQQFIDKLQPEKKALVEKALKNGYTIEEIRQALGE